MAESRQQVVQVVKRFGLCGGMEEYVFRLSENLISLGRKVFVLCEEKVNLPETCRTEVIELSKATSKPRWLSHLLFSQKVDRWIRMNAAPARIVHSHERIACHHVTTIHSALFNFPRKGFPSIRKYFNEMLEERELHAKLLGSIVPVSDVIRRQITQKFPLCQSKLSSPIHPGINEILIHGKNKDANAPKCIGFMGEEWRRKGLPKVIGIWRELKRMGINNHLVLAGFPPSENIGLSAQEMENVTILGWLSDKVKFYSQIDLLLHPAKREAYGMVIAEAASIGIPFVCSSECGASILAKDSFGEAIPENSPIHVWTEEVIRVMKRDAKSEHTYKRSWRIVAEEYDRLYASLEISSQEG
jgi:UDP-glucose:(heptosyl)LPS alpha-1,3-glucosyltransferase